MQQVTLVLRALQLSNNNRLVGIPHDLPWQAGLEGSLVRTRLDPARYQ